MDYYGTKFNAYDFDLQMFAAPVTVDLTEVAGAMTSTTAKYLVGGHWVAADALTTESKIDATLVKGTLTVAATDAGADITVTNATAAQLQGVTFKVVQAFTYNSEEKTVTETNPESSAVTGTFTLGTVQSGLTVKVASAAGSAEEVTAATTVTINSSGNLVLSAAGVVVAANGIDYTAKAASVLALNETVEADKPATLVSGSVQITTAAKSIVASTGETITAGESTTPIVTISGTGETVKAVVSGLTAAAQSFTVKDSEDDATETKYTVGTMEEQATAANIVVSGDQVGTYKDVEVATASVTLASGGDTVEYTVIEDETTIKKTATLAEIGALTITAGDTTGTYKQYYELKWNSGNKEYTVTAAESQESAPTIGDDVLGYFTVVTDANGGDPTATVTFYSGTSTEGMVLGALTVDAEALQKVGSLDITKLTVEDGVASGDVTVDKLYHTATAEGAKTTNYAKYYELAGSIVVNAKNATGTTYFSVTADGGTNELKGKVTYTIQEETWTAEQATASGKAYFAVTATKSEGNPTNYAITFQGNNSQEGEGWKNGPKNLTDACWAGITVNASAITEGTVAITGDKVAETDTTKDKYNVSVGYGATVTFTNADESTTTRTGTPTYTIAYKVGEDPKNGIVVPDATGSEQTEWWTAVETKDGSTGQPTITITKVTGENPSKPTSGNFFTVQVSAKTESTQGAVTITYTADNENPLSLTNIVSKTAEGTENKQIAVDASKLSPANTASIAIADGEPGTATRVDYAVNVAAGVTVTGNDGVINEATEGTRQTVSYVTSNDNEVEIALSTVLPVTATTEATTVYYLAAVDENGKNKTTGYQKIVLGEKDTTITTDNESSEDNVKKNYFKISYTPADNTDPENPVKATYTVTYHAGTVSPITLTEEGSTKGQTTIDATGVDKDMIIRIVNPTDGKTVASYVVNEATKGLTIYEGAADGTVDKSSGINYTAFYTFANGSSTIELGSTSRYWAVTCTKVEDGQGEYRYSIADGVDVPAESNTSDVAAMNAANRFTVTVVDGVATLTYTAGTGEGSISLEKLAADLASGKLQIPIGASGATSAKITSLVLTDDTAGKIDYTITDIPYTVDVINSSTGDTLTYTPSYVLDSTKNTITLGAPTGTASTLYYKVTASGGKSDTTDKGRYTYAIGTTPVAEAERGENYFTVATDANGNVTIGYTHTASGTPPFDLDDIQVKVDGTKSTGNIKVGADASGDDSIKFAVTGLDSTQTLTKTSDSSNAVIDEQDKVYNPTVAFADKDGNVIADGTAAITIGNGTQAETYYQVDYVAGSFATKGVSKYKIGEAKSASEFASDGSSWKAYFKVTYNSEYKVSITYVNKESADIYDLSPIGKSLTISAQGIGANVDTIDITDSVAKSGVNYALTQVPSRIQTITGKGENDTVAYVASGVKVTGEIALPDSGTANYVINADKSVTIMESDPTDSDNYFSVTKDEEGNYTIKYNQAKNGAPYTISTDSKLTVDASTAGSGASITTTNAAASVAITDAPGGVTFTGSNTTITYATTFAWEDGIYYIPVSEGKAAIEVDATITTKVDDSSQTFVPVQVKREKDAKGEYTGKVTVTALSQYDQKTGTSGTPTDSGTTASKPILDVAEIVTVEGKDLVIDVTKSNSNMDIDTVTNVPAGAQVTGVANGKTVETVATLAVGNTVAVNGIEYEAGAAGQLVIAGGTNTDESAVVSGVVALTMVGTTITGSATDWEVTLDAAAAGTSAGVVVTFGKSGQITKITGLDDGDKVTVNKGGTSFTYSYEDGYIRQFNNSDSTKTYSGAASNTSDIMNLTYGAKDATQTVGFMTWGAGEYYSAAADSSNVISIGDYVAKDETKVAQEGEYYAKITLDANKHITGLSIVKGNKKHGVDAVTDFTGTVQITPPSTVAMNYTKGANDTFKVNFINVVTGSTFAKLATGDTVTTAAGASVTVGNVVYAAASGEALAFDGLKITDGVVNLTAGQTQKVGSKTVEYTTDNGATDGVQVTYEGSVIKTITGLSNKEQVTIITYDTDGSTVKETVTYKADASDTTKVVRTTTANGEKKEETLVIEAGGDILSGETASTSIKNNFAWTGSDGQAFVGYFLVNGGAVSIPTTGDTALSQEVTFTKNQRYIKAENTITDGTAVLTLTPMVVTEDGELPTTDTTGNLANIPVNIVAGATKVSYTAAAGKVYTVNLSGLVNGSEVTLGKGDTATSADFGTNAYTIKVNGTTFTNGAASGTGNTIAVTYDGTDARITSGTIVAKGTIYSRYTVGNVVNDVTLTYDKGTSSGTEGVVVAYGATGITSITGLDEGESVTVVDGATITTYEAHSASIIWKYENGTVTKVYEGASNTANLVSDVNTALKPTTATFDWGATADGKTGYFLISDAKAAAVESGTANLTYADVGKSVLVATVDNTSTPNVLTLAKKTVKVDGDLDNASLADGDVKALTLTLPTTKAVSYKKETITSAAITVTNAVNGAVFSDFAATDKVSTIEGFKAGDAIKIGATGSEVAYTAAADGQLVISGNGKAYSGTFAVTTATQFNAYGLSEDKTATTDSVTYTAGGVGEKLVGIAVKVESGAVKSVTGLSVGESATVTHLETTKSGDVTNITTAFTTDVSGESGAKATYVKVTKTETVKDANGNVISTKTSTQLFADSKADVYGTTTGWTVSAEETDPNFDFGKTDKGAVGYFTTTATGSGSAKVYTADVATQSGKNNITAPGTAGEGTDARYYLRATASQAVSGAYTVEDLQLVYLENNGSWTPVTDKTVGTIGITVPTDGNVTFGTNSYVLAVTNAQANGVYKGLGADDTIETATLSDGAKITVGTTEYTSGAAAALKIRGDGTAIVSGTVKTTTETEATFTSAQNGTTVAYTKGESGDGVKVEFETETNVASGSSVVKSITGLDQTTESVVVTEYKEVTDSKGNVTTEVARKTTYTYDGANTVRTIEADGITETASISGTGDLVTGAFVPSSKFDWGTNATENPNGKLGYFQISSTTPGNVQSIDTQTATTALNFENNAEYVRIVASGGKITSLSLYKYTTAGGFASETPDASTATVKIKAPGSLELAADAITLAKDGDGDDIARNFGIEVTATATGQVFKGLSSLDSVTASNFDAGAMLTVNGNKFTTAAITDLTITGDGYAEAGNFALSTANSKTAPLTIKDASDTITEIVYTTGAGARVNVANGSVSGITYFSTANEALTVTKTTAAGVVTTRTYKVSGGYVTMTEVADGTTKTYTSVEEISGDTDNILNLDYAEEGNVTTTSQFDWTAAKNSGYFQVTPTTTTDSEGNVTVTGYGTATVAEQPKVINITKSNAGSYYLKVELSDDYNVKALSLVQVQSDGSLKPMAVTGATGTLNITAPDAALTFDATTLLTGANVAVNITGAAKDSVIYLNNTDTLTTASFAKGDAIAVNNAAANFKAGAAGAMKFLGGAILSSGTVQLDKTTYKQFVAAGADNAALATDNVTVVYNGSASDTPIVTVKNGIVTAISGLNNTTDTIVATEATTNLAITYKMSDTPINNGKLNATVASGTGKAFVTAALADGATVTIDSGTPQVNGAENGTLSFVKESTSFLVKDGVLKLSTQGGSVAAMGTGAAADNITVAYTTRNASASTDVVVTIKNGLVTGLKGLNAGDTITVTDTTSGESVVTTYAVNSAGTTVTKTVGGDATTAQKANIAVGGDVWTATYVGGGEIFDEDKFVGQLSFDTSIAGRNKGYFELTKKSAGSGENKYTYQVTTVAEQPKEVAMKAPTLKADAEVGTKSTANYLAAIFDAGELSISGIKVTAEMKYVDEEDPTQGTYVSTTTDTLDVETASVEGFSANDVITLTAPTTTPIIFDKGKAVYGLVINKLASGSTIKNIDAGDTVTTTTLTKGEGVTMTDHEGSITYTAGANGTLVFKGSGDGTTASNVTQLYSGTIQMTGDGTAKTYGGGTATAPIAAKTLTADAGSDVVTVAVKNGVVSSVTGLVTAGSELTVGTVVYKVLYNDGKNVMMSRKDGTADATFASFATTKSVYSETGTGYAEAGAITSNLAWEAAEKTTTTYGVTSIGSSLSTPATISTTKAAETAALDTQDTTASGVVRGNYFLQATVSTTAAGVSTITAIDVMQAQADGSLKKVTDAYTGTVTIDGEYGASGSEKYATINGTKLPATAKRGWKLTATNVALGSTFGTLGENDQVTTNAGTWSFKTNGKTVTTYAAIQNGTGTDTRAVTYKGSDDAQIAVNASGEITNLVGLDKNGETVTIVSKTTAGESTTIYAASVKNNVVTVTRTITDVNGKKTVETTKGTAEAMKTTNLLDDAGTSWTAGATTIYSDFDWTTAKATTGYFEVTGSGTAAKATVTKKVTTISTDAQKAKTYLAVTIDENGKVASGGISQRKFDKTDDTGMGETDTAFTGTINITAPTAYALQLDRTDALTGVSSIDGTAKFAVTGAISGSVINNLAEGDKVTTARLAVANAAKKIDAGAVILDDVVYTAGAAGSLEITMQTVNNVLRHTLTGGTALLSSTALGEGGSYLYAGTSLIEVDTATDTALTVAAKTTTSRGVTTTTYTIGGLGEGESFTVDGVSYKVSGSMLIRTTTDEDSGKSVYATMKIGTSVTGAVLTNESKWTEAVKTLDTVDDETSAISSSHYKAITVSLATLDKRIAADKKAGVDTTAQQYDFVVDTYIAAPKTQQKALAAQVINDDNKIEDVQTIIGGASTVNGLWTYRATEDGTDVNANTPGTRNKIGQTITAAKDWNVYGSDADDIITGASSSSKDVQVIISGGEGNDAITAGGASENFTFGFGGNGGTNRDTLKGYAAVKDKLTIDRDGDGFDDGGNFAVQLDTAKGGNVFLFADGSNDGVYDSDENGVELMAVAGKAVTIGDATYYFGNGALSGNNTKTTAGTTFTHETGAYYIGNDSGKNSLKVTTDTTKATSTSLGETVTVDLMATDGTRKYYTNIDVVNASASGNRLVLKATDTGSTLTGGKYQTTLEGGQGNDVLTGGSGADVFWFESGLDGKDTIKSYTAKQNDAVYLGAWDSDSTAESANGFTVKADGTNVVLSNGSGLGQVTVEKAVSTTTALRISTDGTSENAVSYYVGKNGTTNASGKVTLAKNNFTATLGTDTADVTSGTLTSYYLGSDTATDTLTVKLASKQTTPVDATFSLASENLKSIDVLDTSGISIKNADKKSSVTLQGAATGTFTLKGEATGKYTTDHFDLTNLQTGANQVTIANLNVDEVIELAAGVKLSNGKYDTKAKAYCYTMTSQNGSAGDLGTLYVTGVKTALTESTVGGTGQDANNVTLTRKA